LYVSDFFRWIYE